MSFACSILVNDVADGLAHAPALVSEQGHDTGRCQRLSLLEQHRLDCPEGAVISAVGTHGQGDDRVPRRGRDTCINHRAVQAKPNQRLLVLRAGEVLLVDNLCHSYLVGGKNVISPGDTLIGEADAGMLLPEVSIGLLLQAAEHGDVPHPVAVQEHVEVCEVRACPAVQQDTPRRVFLSTPGTGEIVGVVRSPEDRVSSTNCTGATASR
jgi:hypothetical protein